VGNKTRLIQPLQKAARLISIVEPAIVYHSAKKLSSDLECGHWEKLYGEVLYFDIYTLDRHFELMKDILKLQLTD
jgi:hypothetical protein